MQGVRHSSTVWELVIQSLVMWLRVWLVLKHNYSVQLSNH